MNARELELVAREYRKKAKKAMDELVYLDNQHEDYPENIQALEDAIDSLFRMAIAK